MPKKPKERFVRVCPRCGSTRTIRTFGKNYISYYYSCQDCNFESPLFPEISASEVKKLPKMGSTKYSMWRRPTTAEVKPLERAVEKKNGFAKAVFVFLILLAVLIIVLAII